MTPHSSSAYYTFDGLENLAVLLGDIAVAPQTVEQGGIGYCAVRRIDNAQSQPQVGKRMWSYTDLASYIEGTEDEDSLASLQDIGPSPSLWDDPGHTTKDHELSERQHRVLATAMVRWMMDIARGNLANDADEVTFKVEVRSPKGFTCLAAPRFKARRSMPGTVSTVGGSAVANIDPTVPLPPIPANAAPRSGAVIDPGVSSWIALQAAHEQLVVMQTRTLGLLQTGYTHLHRVSMATVADLRDVAGTTTRALTDHIRRLHTEASDKDRLIIKLTDELLSIRIDIAGLGVAHQTSEATEKRRIELADAALKQVGKLGELYISGKLDVPPELAELLVVMREDEQLMKVLKDPRLPRGLRDPIIRPMVLDALSAIINAVPNASPAEASSGGHSAEAPTP